MQPKGSRKTPILYLAPEFIADFQERSVPLEKPPDEALLLMFKEYGKNSRASIDRYYSVILVED